MTPAAVPPPWCNACLPKTAIRIRTLRRKICMPRQAHRPRGPVVKHILGNVIYPMRRCFDCGTLVLEV